MTTTTLTRLVGEIDVVAQQNACSARLGLEALACTNRSPSASGPRRAHGAGHGTTRPQRRARPPGGGAAESVLGTAAPADARPGRVPALSAPGPRARQRRAPKARRRGLHACERRAIGGQAVA
ncbi:MAG: hypothetical protein R2711_02165 [Acidimicrobiales bacterium]